MLPILSFLGSIEGAPNIGCDLARRLIDHVVHVQFTFMLFLVKHSFPPVTTLPLVNIGQDLVLPARYTFCMRMLHIEASAHLHSQFC